MIRTEKLIPQVYYDESRDFQVLGRLFDAIANYGKMNIDLMLSPETKESPSQIVKLLATFVGFVTKHNYDNSNLVAVCRSFGSLLREKGSMSAITDAVNILLNSQGIKLKYGTVVSVDKDLAGRSLHAVNIYVPTQLKDVNLLEDLFEYILPAGWVYRIVTVENTSIDNSDSVSIKPSVAITEVDSGKPQITKLDSDTGKVNNESKTYLGVVSGRGK